MTVWQRVRRWRLQALLAGLVLPATALGNGRIPEAQHVVIGPGPSSDTVVLRTTFGLLVSRDGGRSFHWLCEDTMYAPDQVSGISDPAVEIAADGTIVWGYQFGIHWTQSGCNVGVATNLSTNFIEDLASDPSGTVLVAIEDNLGEANHVLRAEGDTSFRRLGFGVTGVELKTVDVAPGHPDRVYVSGSTVGAGEPRLYRSDDQGTTLVQTTAVFGAIDEGPFIAGVDPTSADVLYLRANVGFGSVLWRSRDAGATVQRVATTCGPMLGFALSDDGATVWIGSPNDGILRSDDHGESFVRVSDQPTYCLRYHAGVLWQCGDWTRTWALARSRDRGMTFESVLRFEDIAGPYDCSSVPSSNGNRCVDLWPVQQGMLALPAMSSRDASVHATCVMDAAARTDVGGRLSDTGGSPTGMDAPMIPMGMDGGAASGDSGRRTGAMGPGANCGCATGSPTTPGILGGFVVVGVALSRRRRRRG